ncbi:MAG: hypothetical protein EXX96DRAFT_620506 [Benjaminiella poitrasii]|nr:MAG: hypothetical protein EXX96DRAFT_620506 [Benjaminiella poitrasii]
MLIKYLTLSIQLAHLARFSTTVALQPSDAFGKVHYFEGMLIPVIILSRLIVTTTMSFSFYIEDDLGNVVDEHGNDPMEITENEDPFKLEG